MKNAGIPNPRENAALFFELAADAGGAERLDLIGTALLFAAAAVDDEPRRPPTGCDWRQRQRARIAARTKPPLRRR